MSHSWLSANRVRIHGLLLAACLWSVYAVDMSSPGMLDRNGLIKGTDFLHFYILGKLALLGRGSLLYYMRAQASLAREFVAQSPDGFVRTALRAAGVALFAPLARLPYGWALTAWLAANVLIYGLCCCALWKTCPSLQTHRWTVLILAMAFPGFFHLLAWGQTSGIALRMLHARVSGPATRSKPAGRISHWFSHFQTAVGICCSCGFLLTRQWKLAGGAVIAASLELAAAWIHYGTEVMRAYWLALAHVREVLPLLEPRLYQNQSLRSFWSLLLPWPHLAFALYLVSALAVLVLAVRVWTGEPSLALRFSALLLATVLGVPPRHRV